MSIPASRAIWSRFRILVPALVVAALLPGVSACTKPCVEFGLNDKEILDSSTDNGWSIEIDFDFTPSECNNTCTCDLTAFAQIVRSLDLRNGTHLYPSSEKEARATATGFYLDRLGGRIWGYYGRNNDGSFASTVTPGSDTSTANLRDFPRRPEIEPWLGFLWMAVTGPVCIDTPDSTCNEHLLGYYEWVWWVNDGGTVPWTAHFVSPPAWKDDFDEAVVRWNKQAALLEKKPLPEFTRLAQ